MFTKFAVLDLRPPDVLIIFVLLLAIVAAIGIWKVFVKAGKPGWAALIPLYSSWTLAEIAGKPGWWGLYPLVGFIPFVGWIAVLYVSIVLAMGIGVRFGKSTAFSIIGLVLFSFIGYIILGYGDSRYDPNRAKAAGQTADAPYPKIGTDTTPPSQTPPAHPIS